MHQEKFHDKRFPNIHSTKRTPYFVRHYKKFQYISHSTSLSPVGQVHRDIFGSKTRNHNCSNRANRKDRYARNLASLTNADVSGQANDKELGDVPLVQGAFQAGSSLLVGFSERCVAFNVWLHTLVHEEVVGPDLQGHRAERSRSLRCSYHGNRQSKAKAQEGTPPSPSSSLLSPPALWASK